MLEFQSRRTPGPHDASRPATGPRRSYRELAADGQAELDAARSAAAATGERCPHCGHQLAEPSPTSLPPGMPRRSPSDASARAAALEPAATRLAQYCRDALSEPTTFALWVAPLALADAHAGQLFFAAPAETAAWVAERYGPLLDRAATALAGRQIQCIVFPGTAAARSLGDLISAESPAGD